MQNKLKLDLDEIAVESFDTSGDRTERGTVFGEECTCPTNCTCPGCPTCDETCPATCEFSMCWDTCWQTCQTCYWPQCEDVQQPWP